MSKNIDTCITSLVCGFLIIPSNAGCVSSVKGK
jgi:hypothetical protein